jgi:hypothetical protein
MEINTISDLLVMSFLNKKENITIEEYAEIFFKEYNKKVLNTLRSLLSTYDKKEILKKASISLVDFFMKGSKPKTDFSKFKSIDEFFIFLKTQQNVENQNRLDNLRKKSKSMKFFVDLKPKNKKEEQYWDAIEMLIDSVEKYYIIKEHKNRNITDTEVNLNKNLICSTERAYNTNRGIKKEGVLIKKEPYAGQLTYNVYSILGETTFDVIEKKLYGGFQYGIIIRTDKFLSVQQLIDNIIMNHVLINLPVKTYMKTDYKDFPIFLSADEFWIKNPTYEYSGIDKKLYLTKNTEEINMLETIDDLNM